MRYRSRDLCTMLLAFGVALAGGTGVARAEAEESPAAQSGQASPGQMSPDEMKMMMELSTPGEHHKAMDRLVGNWKTSMKMWMMPGEPLTSEGTVTYQWVLGGRYLQSKHTGNFNNMPFEGMGIDGYDNAKQEYFSAWFDNMGTGMMTMTGKPSDDGKSIVYTGTNFDPMQKRDVPVREEIRWVSDNSYVFTMYMPMPGENGATQDKKVLEITATKQ